MRHGGGKGRAYDSRAGLAGTRDILAMKTLSAAFGGLLATASVAALASLPAQASSVLPAGSAGLVAMATSAARASGGDLLRKAQKALSVAVVAVKALPLETLATSAPFLRAVSDADKALAGVKEAIAGRNDKTLARAISQAARAVGTLNATYKQAKIADPKVKEGVRAFNAAWDRTLRRLGGARPGTAQQAQDNGRRIAALQRQIEALKAKRAQEAADAEELAYLLAALDRAEQLNRNADMQWLALLALDEALGWYGGYYDYLATYHPDLAVAWLDDYLYWNGLYNDYAPAYDAYYDGYDYAAYDEPAAYPADIDINVTIIDEPVLALADAQIDMLGQAADDVAKTVPGFDRLEAAEAALESAPVPDIEDPAATADAEADAQSAQPLDDAAAEALEDEELGADEPAEGPDAEPADEPAADPADEPGEEPAAEEPADEPDAAPADEPGEEPAEDTGEPEADTDGDGTPDAEDTDNN